MSNFVSIESKPAEGASAAPAQPAVPKGPAQGIQLTERAVKKVRSAMAKEGINIMMISTSEIKISCVIDAKYTELAVRMLHETFQMDKAA